MKRFIYSLLSLSLVLGVVSSCQKETGVDSITEPESVSSNSKESDDFSISVVPASLGYSAESFDGETVETKSNFTGDRLDYVDNVSIFVFQSGSFVSANYYIDQDFETGHISAKDIFMQNGHKLNESFDVYLLANCPDYTSDSKFRTIEGINSFVESYHESLSFNNFPMAATYHNYCPMTSTHTLEVKRLISEFNIQFTQSSGNNNVYYVNSGALHDVAREVHPFGATYSIPEGGKFIETFEDFTHDDISSDNRVTLYALENVHGHNPVSTTLTSIKQKRKESLKYEYQDDRVSYLELSVSVYEAETGKIYDDVKYRYYMGHDINDFSVYRNEVVDLKVNFDDIKVNNEGWRIEPCDAHYYPKVVGGKVEYTETSSCSQRSLMSSTSIENFGIRAENSLPDYQYQYSLYPSFIISDQNGNEFTVSLEDNTTPEGLTLSGSFYEWRYDFYDVKTMENKYTFETYPGMGMESVFDEGIIVYDDGGVAFDSDYICEATCRASIPVKYGNSSIQLICVAFITLSSNGEYGDKFVKKVEYKRSGSYKVRGPVTVGNTVQYFVSVPVDVYFDGEKVKTINVEDTEHTGCCEYNGVAFLDYTADIVHGGTWDACDDLTFPTNDSSYNFSTLKINVTYRDSYNLQSRYEYRIVKKTPSQYGYTSVPILFPWPPALFCFRTYNYCMHVEYEKYDVTSSPSVLVDTGVLTFYHTGKSSQGLGYGTFYRKETPNVPLTTPTYTVMTLTAADLNAPGFYNLFGFECSL